MKRNWWAYKGTAANALTGGGEIEKDVTLSMRVVDTVEGKSVKLFIPDGHQSDLAWEFTKTDRLKTTVKGRRRRHNEAFQS